MNLVNKIKEVYESRNDGKDGRLKGYGKFNFKFETSYFRVSDNAIVI